MSTATFVLQAYPDLPAPDGVRISGVVRREGPFLHLEWRLDAPEGTVAVPGSASSPERRRDLWEATCFEFFLASPGRPGYWEFNLAPSGHWNVFRFEGYRTGMADASAFQALPFHVSREAGGCTASARIDLSALGLAADAWSLAVSTVVAEHAGRVTYWALAHPGDAPDFHHPDAFGLRLEA